MAEPHVPAGRLPSQLRFALEQLRANQWERFEEFASAYLVVDFPGLRTVAGSGDRGRDADLVEPPGDPRVRIQYSVAQGWSSKISQTVDKVMREFPDVRQLVYATNQKIGPSADDLKAQVRRDHGLFIDICDITYFVERCELDAGRAAAADGLIDDIAIPILADRGLVEHTAPALSSTETRAACVYLALEWSDTAREKGLTKLCFEALVRSVLRGTGPENRLARSEVRRRVAQLVDASDVERSNVLTDAALARLERRAVQRWPATDEFCVTRSERLQEREELTRVQLAETELLEAIAWELGRTYEAFEVMVPNTVLEEADCIRTAVETVLLEQGERFAMAVSSGDPIRAPEPDIESAVRSAMLATGIQARRASGRITAIFEATTHVVLTEPAEPVQDFFRAFADAYTLFAFLRQTPDVQSAIVKLYSIGEIWLDTSILLPLIAETLVEDPARRRFTNMLRAGLECGLRFFVTQGVLEELERNTWNSIQYARKWQTWRSREPFLARIVLMSGRDLSELPAWIAEFRGTVRPNDDLALYLAEEHGISVGSLWSAADGAPTEVRAVVQESWHEGHEKRREGAIDQETRARLVAHDVENYLGVVGKRDNENAGPYGYKTWWLTLDRVAYSVSTRLREEFGRDAPDSPVMSPDFMVTYLAVGPLRSRLKRETESHLPLSVADLPGEGVPELMKEAMKVRQGLQDMSDRVLRREVRDRLDRYRRRQGPFAQRGLHGIEKDLSHDMQTVDLDS
jgi:predicted nucleic acid-binding protein